MKALTGEMVYKWLWLNEARIIKSEFKLWQLFEIGRFLAFDEFYSLDAPPIFSPSTSSVFNMTAGSEASNLSTLQLQLSSCTEAKFPLQIGHTFSFTDLPRPAEGPNIEKCSGDRANHSYYSLIVLSLLISAL